MATLGLWSSGWERARWEEAGAGWCGCGHRAIGGRGDRRQPEGAGAWVAPVRILVCSLSVAERLWGRGMRQPKFGSENSLAANGRVDMAR